MGIKSTSLYKEEPPLRKAPINTSTKGGVKMYQTQTTYSEKINYY